MSERRWQTFEFCNANFSGRKCDIEEGHCNWRIQSLIFAWGSVQIFMKSYNLIQRLEVILNMISKIAIQHSNINEAQEREFAIQVKGNKNGKKQPCKQKNGQIWKFITTYGGEQNRTQNCLEENKIELEWMNRQKSPTWWDGETNRRKRPIVSKERLH